MNKKELEHIASKVGNSFFVYEKEELQTVYNKLSTSLGDNGIIAFSIKSNYSPDIIRDLKALNSWFEVSSLDEYEYVLSLGLDAAKIVINAPVSTPEFFIKCQNNDSLFNIQNAEQWNFCKEIAKNFPSKTLKVGLRLNLGYNSRFGLSQAMFDFLINEVSTFYNIELISLHVHVCEGERSIASFKSKFSKLQALTKSKSLDKLKYLNIGGGFYSQMVNSLSNQFEDEIPSLDDYLEVLKQLSRESEFKVIIEPGGLLVANSMKFYTKVLSIDQLSKNIFIQVDGSIYDIQPTKSSKQLPFHVFSDSSKKVSGQVVGFTCMEDDILIRSFKENIDVGDWIVFTNVGAYAQTLRPAFISSWKPVVTLGNNGLNILREKSKRQNLFVQWS